MTTEPDGEPPRHTDPRAITYIADYVHAFMRSRDRNGQLSNMTHGYPLTVNHITFQGPEGLYQALKFPGNARAQQSIASQKSGMDAKKVAYTFSAVRNDWTWVRINAMRYAVALKLQHHPRKFSAALLETGNWPIVEKSHQDDFWGAKPRRSNTMLTGVNMLGKILTDLRNELRRQQGDVDLAVTAFLMDIPQGQLTINDQLIAIPEQRA